jgi:hypothetical protein
MATAIKRPPRYKLSVYRDAKGRAERLYLDPTRPHWQALDLTFDPSIKDAESATALRLARMAAGASSSEAWANPDPDGPGELDCSCHRYRGTLIADAGRRRSRRLLRRNGRQMALRPAPRARRCSREGGHVTRDDGGARPNHPRRVRLPGSAQRLA